MIRLTLHAFTLDEHYSMRLDGRSAYDRAKVFALRTVGIMSAQVRANSSDLSANARDAVRYLDHLDFPFGALEAPVQPQDHRGERLKHLLHHDVVPDSFASGAGARCAVNVVPGGPRLGVERAAVSTTYCMSATALLDSHCAGLRPTRQE